MNFIRQKLATLQNRATDLQDGLRRWSLYADDLPASMEGDMKKRLVPAERASFDTDQEISKERLGPISVQLRTLSRWYDYVLEQINEQFNTANSLLAQGRTQECFNVLNDVERRMIVPNEETLGFVFRAIEQHAGIEHHQKLAAVDAIIRELYLPTVRMAHERSLVAKETMALTPLVYFMDPASDRITWRHHARASLNVGRALPLSLIGVPRILKSQPWNFVAVAHEVGLSVYADINLSWEIINKLQTEALNSGVSSQTAALWANWNEIIFADIFGTLKLGPAYVSGMIELLSADPAAVANFDVSGPYPPVALRWHIMLQTLHLLNYEHQARELNDQIQILCGDVNQITQVAGQMFGTLINECRAVTGVVAFSPCQKLAGARVIDIVNPFLATEYQVATKVKDLLLAGDESCSEDDSFGWAESLNEVSVTAPAVLAGLRMAFDGTADLGTSRRIQVRFWCLLQKITSSVESTREREDREFAPADAVLKSMAQKSIPTFATSPIDRPVAMV